MAEALNSELFYQCNICMEDMTERNPRLLFCHHSFCEECLQKLTRRSDITCPTCRQVTHVTNNNVATLTMDFKLLEMKERESKFSMMPNNVTLCQLCNGKSASKKCFDCNNLFCESCILKHDKTKIFKLHKVVDKCQKHPEGITHICEQCIELACHRCIILDHSEHDHLVHEYKDGLKILQANIQKLAGSVQAAEIKRFMKDAGIPEDITVPKEFTWLGKPKLKSNIIPAKTFEFKDPCDVRCLKNSLIGIAEREGPVSVIDHSGRLIKSHKVNKTQGNINGLYSKDGCDLFIIQRSCLSKINIYNSDLQLYHPMIFNMNGILLLEGTSQFIISASGNRELYEYNADTERVKKIVNDFGISESIRLVKRHEDVYFISSHVQGCIKIHNKEGTLLKSIDTCGRYDSQMKNLLGITTVSDYIFVCDWQNHRVCCFNMDGHFIKHIITKQDGIQFPWYIDFQFPYLWLIEGEAFHPTSIKAFQIMVNNE